MSADHLRETPVGGDAPARSTREQARRIGALVVAALAILFAVLNLDTVRVNWLVTTTRTPLIVVIAISFLAGAALAWLVGRRRRRRA